MPADLPPPLRRRVPLWAFVVLGLGAIGAGAVVLPMLRLDPVPRLQQAPDLAAPAPVAGPSESLPGNPPDPRVPRFDLVRTGADGQTIVAGRAAPNVDVAVVVDGVTRAETRSDGAGQFVAFLMLERSDAARVLWLVAHDPQGDRLASDDTVILAPDVGLPGAGSGADPAVAAPAGTAPTVAPVVAPGAALSASPGRPASSGANTPLAARADRTDVQTIPQADRVAGLTTPVHPGQTGLPGDALDAMPLIGRDTTDPAPRPGGGLASVQPLVSDADGVRVMSPVPLAGDALRVDSVAYGAEGAVVLRGRVDPGAPGSIVRVTLSGLPPTEVAPEPDGTWTLRLLDVAPGDYRLDVARVGGPGGTGTDTVTLPFRRAAPDDVAAALDGEAARIVTVQPGATLWAIARDRYGDGARYVQVYDANRGAITDPDLIYPGQIFRLPEAAPGSGDENIRLPDTAPR